MESTRIETRTWVTSNSFSYNDTFAITIVGLGEKVATQLYLISLSFAQMKISLLISAPHKLIGVIITTICYILQILRRWKYLHWYLCCTCQWILISLAFIISYNSAQVKISSLISAHSFYWILLQDNKTYLWHSSIELMILLSVCWYLLKMPTRLLHLLVVEFITNTYVWRELRFFLRNFGIKDNTYTDHKSNQAI